MAACVTLILLTLETECHSRLTPRVTFCSRVDNINVTQAAIWYVYTVTLEAMQYLFYIPNTITSLFNLFGTFVGEVNMGRSYRLLTLYCEIVVGPSYWVYIAELARLHSPKNEVQQWFHSTGSITFLLHTFIL